MNWGNTLMNSYINEVSPSYCLEPANLVFSLWNNSSELHGNIDFVVCRPMNK